MKRFEVIGLETVPEIKPADNLPEIIVDCANREAHGIREKDVVILTSKIVSKAMGLTMLLGDVKYGRRAERVSKKTGKDPRWLEMIWNQGQQIIAVIPISGMVRDAIMASSHDPALGLDLCEHERAICITCSANGRIHTCDAGIDGSNHPAGVVSFLPPDPDEAAEAIREEIETMTGKNIAVILADTEIVHLGTMDLAVGSSGIEPRGKEFASKDLFGKGKFGGMDLTAYELTSAAALVFGQADAGIPVVIIRGFDYQISKTETIQNTLFAQASSGQIRHGIKQVLKATSYARGLKERLLLRIASWLI